MLKVRGHGSGVTGLDCLSDGVAVLKVRGQRSRGLVCPYSTG